MINILIVPAWTEIWLEIYHALEWCKDITLFWWNENSSNPAEILYKNFFSNVLPIMEWEKFVRQVDEIVKSSNIDIVYPASDDWVLILSKYKHLLSCPIVGPDFFTNDIARSKKKTYDNLKDLINVPKMYDINNIQKSDFPLFVKPEKWAWAVNSFKVNNMEQLNFYLESYPNLIISEYLPWEEFTVDCFSSKWKLLYCGWRKRIRIKNGIAVNTKTINIPEFYDFAEKINNDLKMDWARFFQVKYNKDNKLTLLEVEPRISWSMSTNRMRGINFPLLSVYNKLGYPIEVITNDYDVTLDRALANRYIISNIQYDNVYIDLDDTIILKWNVNLLIIRFLYQCINQWKKIILLTKHDQSNLDEYLNKFRIYQIFDKIIKLKRDDEKYNYITSKNSIFIDDSFWERKKIKEKLWIPTFDLSNIECLLDYKN